MVSQERRLGTKKISFTAESRMRKPIAKLSTTKDAIFWKNAWTIGYSPYYTTSLWYGYNKSLGQWNNGAALAGRVWSWYMKDIHEDLPKKEFHRPTGIVERNVCTVTGDLYSQKCDHSLREVFKAGTEPTEFCTYHTSSVVQKEEAVIKVLKALSAQYSKYELFPTEVELFDPFADDDDTEEEIFDIFDDDEDILD